MSTSFSPYDLLPIVRPLEDIEVLPDIYFYENVAQHLIKDIVRIEANGIPVDLEEVQKLDVIVTAVLKEVQDKLQSNSAMLAFLTKQSSIKQTAKIEELNNKKKTYEEFLKPFVISNKVHRTYLVNTYLTSVNKTDMCLEEWSIKDLKKLNQIIGSQTIQNIIDKKETSYMQEYIDKAMENLARDKGQIYNKNKIDNKIENLKQNTNIKIFNPGSPLQKQDFFAYYNVESENETTTGKPQWNRAELERLSKLLDLLVDSKGETNNE